MCVLRSMLASVMLEETHAWEGLEVRGSEAAPSLSLSPILFIYFLPFFVPPNWPFNAPLFADRECTSMFVTKNWNNLDYMQVSKL